MDEKKALLNALLSMNNKSGLGVWYRIKSIWRCISRSYDIHIPRWIGISLELFLGYSHKSKSVILELKKIVKRQNSHKTSCAVSRLLGSRTSIFRTKSFALSEILGQGSESKSRSPCRTCSNIPCSVSTWYMQKKEQKREISHNQLKTSKELNFNLEKLNSHLPKREALHLIGCKGSHQHSKHLLLGHNAF